MVGLVDKTRFDIFETGRLVGALRKQQRQQTAVLFRRLAEQDELSHDDLAMVFIQARFMGLDVSFWVIRTSSMNIGGLVCDAQTFVDLVTHPKSDSAPVRLKKDVAGPLLTEMADKLESMDDVNFHDELKIMRRSS